MYENKELYNEGDLIYLLVSPDFSLQMGTMQFLHYYVGPLVVYTILDATHLHLRGLENRVLADVYHINSL